MALDPKAVKAANEALWKAHPELKGRQLTAGANDAALRKEWTTLYSAPANSAPPKNIGSVCLPCLAQTLLGQAEECVEKIVDLITNAVANWETDSTKNASSKPTTQEAKPNKPSKQESKPSEVSQLDPPTVNALIVDKFRNAGYNDYAIAAVLGNAERESSFIPNIMGDYPKDPVTNRPDKSKPPTSYGLFQWHNERIDGLKTYSGIPHDTVIVDLNIPAEKQIDWALYELAHNFPSAYKALRNAMSVEDAVDAMAQYEIFEGYNVPNSHEYQLRMSKSKLHYSALVNASL